MTMNFKHLLALSVLLVAWAAAPAWAAKETNLLEMMDELDKLDKLDFQSAVDKANRCTRARNFSCSASELAKAKKVASSTADKKTLLAAERNLSEEREQLAHEIRRAEEERQAKIRKEEEAREARLRQEQQDARAAEDRQSTRNYNTSIGAQILRGGATNAALLNKVDRQIGAAARDSSRIQAEQAAERARVSAERQERTAPSRTTSASRESNTSDYSSPSESAGKIAGAGVTGGSRPISAPTPIVVAQDEKKWCVFENSIRRENFAEGLAREKIQQELGKIRAATVSNAGEPMRFLSDSGIQCAKENTAINPEYKCAATYKVEILTFFRCQTKSSGPSDGMAR